MHMKKIFMAAGLVAVIAVVGYMVHQHFFIKKETVEIQFAGIGIGGQNSGVGFGETQDGRPVIGIPWGKAKN